MNILIINAFGTSPSAKAKYTSFCNLIKNTLKRISKNTGIDSCSFTYKDPTNIDEYIYDPDFNPNEGTKTNITNKKNFDKIDMIFIDGCEKYLPWERIGYKLSLLIRLCKVCNKILYAGGVGLEILVYYLATGSRNELNFINAKGEVQSIEEIHLIPHEFLNEIKKNDHFLDFVTGDVFEYRTITRTWESIVNIGLHKQMVAEKYISRGKFVLPNHYTDNHYNDKTIISNCKELKVSIMRQFFSHWLVKGLPNEFVCFSSLTWFPHYVNVNYEKFQFLTICDSNKGPVVIEHGDSVGVAFHASSQYKYTEIILENFIKHKFKDLHEKLYHLSLVNQGVALDQLIDPSKIRKEKDVPSMFKSYKINDEVKLNELKSKIKSKSIRPLSFIDKINSSRPFSKKLKVKKEAAHCGMSLNNRNMIFVEDNSINQRPVSCYGMKYFNFKKGDYSSREHHNIYNTFDNAEQITKTLFEETVGYDFSDKNSLRPNENARISSLFKVDDNHEMPTVNIMSSRENQNNKKRRNTLEHINKTGKLESSRLNKVRDKMDKRDQYAEDYFAFINKENMEEDQMIGYYKRLRREICNKLEEINSSTNGTKERKRVPVLYRNNKRQNKGSSYTNICLSKHNSINSKLAHTKDEIMNNYSDNNLVTSSGSQYISMYPYVKKQTGFQTVKVPLYNEPSFPMTTEETRSELEPHFYEPKHKESQSGSSRLNTTDKERNKCNKLYLKSDKDSKTDIKWMNKTEYKSNMTLPFFEDSKKKYENTFTVHKFRDVNPKKWLSPNGFVV